MAVMNNEAAWELASQAASLVEMRGSRTTKAAFFDAIMCLVDGSLSVAHIYFVKSCRAIWVCV